MADREHFTSNIGFVLACTGAAVGLGNLWMFPWRLGQYGGAAFLVPYLLFVYVLGTTGLMGEFAFGRWSQRGPMGSFDKVMRLRGSKLGRWLGAYPVLMMTGAVTFYAIVTGWILHYVYATVSGGYFEATDTTTYFNQIAGQPQSILWQAGALLVTFAILYLGVAKGLERANRIFMPLLLALFVLLLIRSVTLPGAMAGIRYLLVPDWSYLLKPITWGMALGQAFFTVSLGGGMVVFGSYLKPDSDIPQSAVRTATLDTIAALLASFMIIPAVFAYGLNPAAGPPLLFITLPEIFRAMPAGQIFGLLFFFSITLAAVSSLMSMMEVVTEGLMDQFRWSRGRSLAVVSALCMLVGLPLALDMVKFGQFVDAITVYFLPASAVLCAFMFFWVYGVDKARQELNKGAGWNIGAWWNPVAKYIFVGIAFLVVILQIAVGIG